jgi:hypothetical protein
MVRYASAPGHVQASAHELMQAMNQSIASGLAAAGAGSVRAGTTAAIVEDAGACLHFLIVGDSGIRINGTELLRFNKDIDLIYTAGRVAVFRLLKARGWAGDALEMRWSSRPGSWCSRAWREPIRPCCRRQTWRNCWRWRRPLVRHACSPMPSPRCRSSCWPA